MGPYHTAMWKQEPATQLHGNGTLPNTVMWKQDPAKHSYMETGPCQTQLHGNRIMPQSYMETGPCHTQSRGNRNLPHKVMWKHDPAIQLSRSRIPPHISVTMKWNQDPATQLNSWNWDPATHLAGTMWSRNSLTYSNISTPLGVVGSRQKTYVQERINPLEHSNILCYVHINH